MISSSEGINFINKNINFQNCTLWIGSEDKEMTKELYIVPGIGDALVTFLLERKNNLF